jgi:hypothetical protein
MGANNNNNNNGLVTDVTGRTTSTITCHARTKITLPTTTSRASRQRVATSAGVRSTLEHWSHVSRQGTKVPLAFFVRAGLSPRPGSTSRAFWGHMVLALSCCLTASLLFLHLTLNHQQLSLPLLSSQTLPARSVPLHHPHSGLFPRSADFTTTSIRPSVTILPKRSSLVALQLFCTPVG